MKLLLLLLAITTAPATAPSMMSSDDPMETPPTLTPSAEAPSAPAPKATLAAAAPVATTQPTVADAPAAPEPAVGDLAVRDPGSDESADRANGRFTRNRNNDSDRSSRRQRGRGSPSLAATTPVAGNPRSMSSEYSILLNRSMFVRGHVSVDSHREGGVAPPPPGTEPSLARPETTLVFNGVTVANGNPLAFIEDTSTQRVQTVQVGQQISQGKITDITLDTLAYRNSSRTVVLHIGQDLSGHDAVAAAATSPNDIPSSGDPALDRLRKRRLQELLGK